MVKEVVVLSLGGSLVSTAGGIDAGFLGEFRDFVLKGCERRRFIIVVGGGKVARDYQAAEKITKLGDGEKDWIGIYATWLNAELVRALFGKQAHKKIGSDPDEKLDFKEDILVAGGWEPGFSTDYDSVLWAKRFGAKRLVNMSDVDYVYDKDPKKHSDSKPIEKISWKEFRKIVGNEWKPGSRLPFDPVAAREAERLGMKVMVLNGRDLGNVGKCIDGKSFKGTVVS